MPRALASRSMSGVSSSGDTLQGQRLVSAHLHGPRRQARARENPHRMCGIDHDLPVMQRVERRQLELAFTFGRIQQQQQIG